jgi:hypothetical protein
MCSFNPSEQLAVEGSSICDREITFFLFDLVVLNLHVRSCRQSSFFKKKPRQNSQGLKSLASAGSEGQRQGMI